MKLLCTNAKATASLLATLSSEEKNQALNNMADALQVGIKEILKINQEDLSLAKKNQQTTSFIDRLTLTEDRFNSMVKGLRDIAKLPDAVNKILKAWSVDSGLHISRVSVPLGVIGVIYESRPNVTADAAALCFKSGNTIILRGGSECANTNKVITSYLQQGLKKSGIPEYAIQYMPTQSRHAVNELLKMDEYIDVIIPRGGKSLIQHIREHSTIPVFSHLDGICHTYIHEKATLNMACDIVVNAKMRRPGICGATETMLIDKTIAKTFLPKIISALTEKNCEVRGDSIVQSMDAQVKPATEDDWTTEYLDAILSIKVVNNIDEAIAHINHYHSNHTDAIITEDQPAAKHFINAINSAIVMHNCSTQFADGGEFGMGAEIGIATGKLHARGPVGIEQLTTFKYVVEGSGQTRQ